VFPVSDKMDKFLCQFNRCFTALYTKATGLSVRLLRKRLNTSTKGGGPIN